ncbi:MAG: hypothetical protein C4B59_00585 [Candidatus Methanogaster sp.]|uniref:Uncharacterized protein n=1 Tax=Candidatus Methanogaster sp. TaxID=3386292 RepID=A0AC61L6V5_9EURY|nr:MAG: hypothetical protein C4B59_00585 [ANME-2 cluster archaeon]
MTKGEPEARTYLFRVVVEPDEDRWHAYCPALEDIGGATWGHTREEALKNIREVVEMIIEELIEDGEHIPEALENEVRIFPESALSKNPMVFDDLLDSCHSSIRGIRDKISTNRSRMVTNDANCTNVRRRVHHHKIKVFSMEFSVAPSEPMVMVTA